MKRKLSIILVMCMVLGMLMPTVPALAVTSGSCGTNVTWTLDSEGVLAISGTGAMTNFASASSVPWKEHKDSIVKVEKAIDKAIEMNLNGIAITDHACLSSHVFAEKYKDFDEYKEYIFPCACSTS